MRFFGTGITVEYGDNVWTEEEEKVIMKNKSARAEMWSVVIHWGYLLLRNSVQQIANKDGKCTLYVPSVG